jgi:hypothetical protein
MLRTAGAVASITGRGVSVTGFAVVLRRLERLEQNLNEAMQGLRAVAERLHRPSVSLGVGACSGSPRIQEHGRGTNGVAREGARRVRDGAWSPRS